MSPPGTPVSEWRLWELLLFKVREGAALIIGGLIVTFGPIKSARSTMLFFGDRYHR